MADQVIDVASASGEVRIMGSAGRVLLRHKSPQDGHQTEIPMDAQALHDAYAAYTRELARQAAPNTGYGYDMGSRDANFRGELKDGMVTLYQWDPAKPGAPYADTIIEVPLRAFQDVAYHLLDMAPPDVRLSETDVQRIASATGLQMLLNTGAALTARGQRHILEDLEGELEREMARDTKVRDYSRLNYDAYPFKRDPATDDAPGPEWFRKGWKNRAWDIQEGRGDLLPAKSEPSLDALNTITTEL